MWLVPGHHKDALTIVEGVVIDNRNQFLYFAGSAEGTGSTLGPLAVIEEKDAIASRGGTRCIAFGERPVEAGARGAGLRARGRYETRGK
jgi:hypothetical protein